MGAIQPTSTNPKRSRLPVHDSPYIVFGTLPLCTKAHAFNLGVRRQLPPSDDLPCATLPAMVGDPLPALPIVKIGVAQSAIAITAYFFYFQNSVHYDGAPGFFMGFHYLLSQKSTSLSRGA